MREQVCSKTTPETVTIDSGCDFTTALVLGEERRKDGRWVGWKHKELAKNLASSGERKAKEQCGLILDTLGRDALRDNWAMRFSRHEEAVAVELFKRTEQTGQPPTLGAAEELVTELLGHSDCQCGLCASVRHVRPYGVLLVTERWCRGVSATRRRGRR
jgi:hypothetical protein